MVVRGWTWRQEIGYKGAGDNLRGGDRNVLDLDGDGLTNVYFLKLFELYS